MRKLFNDEAGFIVSAELALLITIMFCGVAVGAVMVRDSVVSELGDISEAIGALNQSYNFRSIEAEETVGDTHHATCTGSGFNDELDDCDCVGIDFPVVGGKDDPSDLAGDEGT